MKDYFGARNNVKMIVMLAAIDWKNVAQ